ncbi:MAG: hypothetical protein IJV66_00695, partial [Firmicutes bacterium]|nr:hypothetical protein [Bacillota bacterium]
MGSEITKKNAEKFLLDHAKSDPVSFHMPGHKGAAFYREHGHGEFLDNMMDCDITEIEGADNLFHDDGILRETAEKYEKLYGAQRSFLLVNGTSGGIIASILAAVPRGGKLIMARNCHKSVYNAMRLGDITPEYVYPEVLPGYGISGQIGAADVKAAIDRAPDAAAVILPSPNYYGICSDIGEIAKVVHDYGKVFIVDQAHGAHLKMMEAFSAGMLPRSAESSGADMVINSTHKTLASFTQSGVLNLCGDRVQASDVAEKLQMIESSSPSYLLMASLDINASVIEEEGDVLFRDWVSNVSCFYEKADGIPGIRVMERMPLLDFTKLNIDFSGLGLTGAEASRLLIGHNIYPELDTGSMVMCMTGIGTTREHVDRLIAALEDISESQRGEGCASDCGRAGAQRTSVAEASGAAQTSGQSALQTEELAKVWNKRRKTYDVP